MASEAPNGPSAAAAATDAAAAQNGHTEAEQEQPQIDQGSYRRRGRAGMARQGEEFTRQGLLT